MPRSPMPGAIVRFSTFEVDRRSGERKAGMRISLPDQSLEILLRLIEASGELVTREELHHELWPADTFVDFEHGLNSAVKACARRSAIPPTRRASSKRCPGGATGSSPRQRRGRVAASTRRLVPSSE